MFLKSEKNEKCPLANIVENIDCRQISACPSITPPQSVPLALGIRALTGYVKFHGYPGRLSCCRICVRWTVRHCGRRTIPQSCSTVEPSTARTITTIIHRLTAPYSLRHRAHSLQLPQHSTQLSDSNFLTRMLNNKNTYQEAQFSPFVSLTKCIAFLLPVVGLHFAMP